MQKPTKYRAKKAVVVNGEAVPYSKEIHKQNHKIFDSLAEAKFYVHLVYGLNLSEGADFTLQPVFTLQPEYTHKGKKIQPIKYVADFMIGMDVIDVKGMATPQFKMKAKMFNYIHGDQFNLWVIKEMGRKGDKKWVMDTGKKKGKIQYEQYLTPQEKGVM